MLHSPSRMIGGVLGLAGFVSACIAGIASGSDPVGTLWRALTALVVCMGVGALLGRLGMVAVREYTDAHKAANPLPEDNLKTLPAEDLYEEVPEVADLAQPAQAA